MAHKKTTFEILYEALNPAQKKAVDSIEGPVMVIAGPGTGKTQVLTLRIANILKKTDINPENILALTFTEAASISMRRRLVEIMGSAAYGVRIHTFHGFSNDVIKRYPESFPRIIGARHITEVDQVKIIERVLQEGKFKALKPFGDPFFYLRHILRNIGKLKQEAVSPKDFVSIVGEEERVFTSRKDLYHEKGRYKGEMKKEHLSFLTQLGKNKELGKIYKTYEEILQKEKMYDWEDMIVEVKKTLEKNKNLRRMLQEEYQYILVDEHQDTNTAQNKTLELLSEFHDNPNIFVVGDEKQAIFRFQGASLENFLHFKKLYPKAELIILDQNYRSTQTILDSAHSLISGKKKLRAHVSFKNSKMRLKSFEKVEGEYIFLASEIRKKIQEGENPQEIAVLYRDNSDVFPIARIFEKYKIPFVIESNRDILEDREVRKFLRILRAIHDFGSDEALAEALHVDFLNLDSLDVYRVLSHSKKGGLFDVIASDKALKVAGVKEIKKMLNFSDKLSEWRKRSLNDDLEGIFETVIQESGFLSQILSLPDSAERMDTLSLLFDEIRKISEAHRGARLEDFFSYLETIETHGMFLDITKVRHTVPRVRLMTAHRAKGLEFDYVYIIDVHDGHWGNRKRRDHLPLFPRVFSLLGRELEYAENDDERRLFYVAITRARKQVSVLYAKIGKSGKEQLPSQFLSEISSQYIEKKEEKNIREKDKKILISPRKSQGIPVKSREFVRELFENQGLSVTGLNNYLICPWRYFYLTLLRIPKKKESYLMYGTAVHAALKDFFGGMKKRTVSKKFLLDSFTLHLSRQALGEREYERFLERGKEALSGYYEWYKKDWKERTLTEFDIENVFLGKIRLTGKLDKLEILEGGRVNVVDYKTGKPKSMAYIEGSVKGSGGEIKRQLVFYNLLLSLYKDGKKFEMASGEIDFVEPNDRGRYKKEKFEIVPEEIEELKETIQRVSKEIQTLSFWNTECGEKSCAYCELRRIMR